MGKVIPQWTWTRARSFLPRNTDKLFATPKPPGGEKTPKNKKAKWMFPRGILVGQTKDRISYSQPRTVIYSMLLTRESRRRWTSTNEGTSAAKPFELSHPIWSGIKAKLVSNHLKSNISSGTFVRFLSGVALPGEMRAQFEHQKVPIFIKIIDFQRKSTSFFRSSQTIPKLISLTSEIKNKTFFFKQ